MEKNKEEIIDLIIKDIDKSIDLLNTGTESNYLQLLLLEQDQLKNISIASLFAVLKCSEPVQIPLVSKVEPSVLMGLFGSLLLMSYAVNPMFMIPSLMCFSRSTSLITEAIWLKKENKREQAEELKELFNICECESYYVDRLTQARINLGNNNKETDLGYANYFLDKAITYNMNTKDLSFCDNKVFEIMKKIINDELKSNIDDLDTLLEMVQKINRNNKEEIKQYKTKIKKFDRII